MPKQEIKISDVLHDAADNYLMSEKEIWTGTSDNIISILHKDIYSCNAIKQAAWIAEGNNNPYWMNDDKPQTARRVFAFLNDYCGMHHNARRVSRFNDVPDEQRQEVRYTWLKMCALLAEEMNL